MDPSVFSTPTQTNSLAAAPSELEGLAPPAPPDPYANDRALLDLFEIKRKESTDYRWVWEREWMRDLWYIANRQWITYMTARRDWVDKRLQKWIPRPVTNKMAEVVQAIRTTLGAINLSITARPVSGDTESISASQIADQMAPLIHEEHSMNQVMREADFWLIATGNACLQLSWDTDTRFNKLWVPSEQCAVCGYIGSPQDIVTAGNVCPTCGSNQFSKAIDPTTGKDQGQWVPFGKGKTTALSPFEYAIPANVTRWDELPYIIRLRWRDKSWFEANRSDLVNKIVWEKTPTDRSLQIFKSLSVMNDVGTTSQFGGTSDAGASTVEGVTEYELWMKPTPDYPEGLVMRVIGGREPILLRTPEESLPGPFPFKDIEGNPLFPFVHAQYEHMGGRLYGRGALAPLIQKQDQLNQLDSLIQLIVQRMANPVWVLPENAGIEQFTGEPGLIIKWNTLAANGLGKPEKIAGSEVPSTLYQLRAQILKDIEELSGAFDIIKGQKPSGVEAFSALQLLVERSQSRFTSVFQSRGEMYRKWFSIAIELERQFGPQQRVMAVVGPNRGYTFKNFENAQLQSAMTFVIEDGSNMPKTALGKRAAIEQANQLGLLDPHDPDQKYALLQQFGLSDLVPTLNYHVQAALQIQDAFEKWVLAPQGPPPLVLKPWFDPQFHWVEHIKWLNTDKMRDLIARTPQIEPIIDYHLQELQMAMAPPTQVDPVTGRPVTQSPQGSGAPGGGQAMNSSNRESGGMKSMPKGNAQGPNMGPS